MLLIFDNCEHMLDACTSLANDLLKSLPRSSRCWFPAASRWTYLVRPSSACHPSHFQNVLEAPRYELQLPGARRFRKPCCISDSPTSKVDDEQPRTPPDFAAAWSCTPLAIDWPRWYSSMSNRSPPVSPGSRLASRRQRRPGAPPHAGRAACASSHGGPKRTPAAAPLDRLRRRLHAGSG